MLLDFFTGIALSDEMHIRGNTELNSELQLQHNNHIVFTDLNNIHQISIWFYCGVLETHNPMHPP